MNLITTAMALILTAASNFANNINAYEGRRVRHLIFKSCSTRRAVMNEVNLANEGILVVASLDTIAADVAKLVTADPGERSKSTSIRCSTP